MDWSSRFPCQLLFIVFAFGLIMLLFLARLLSTYTIIPTQSFTKPENVPACMDPCLENTGINGSWVQDFGFARDYGQYDTPLVLPEGPYARRTGGAHVPSKEAPFPWRTSWKWVDRQCPVDIMTYANICRITMKLNIRHFLFYGDSLTESHHRSFVNKMNSTNFDKNTGVLTCHEQHEGSSMTPYAIRIFHERDNGGNGKPRWPRGVYRLENNTKKFIHESNGDRMLGIFNIGAHYHNFTHYIEDMNTMIETLEEVNRTQDIYFFRATSPGHKDCLPRNKNVTMDFSLLFLTCSS